MTVDLVLIMITGDRLHLMIMTELYSKQCISEHELYSKQCNSELMSCPPPPRTPRCPFICNHTECESHQHRLSTGLRRTGAMAVFSALHLLFLLQLVTSALAQVRDAGRSTINRALLLIAWDIHIHI